VVDQNRLIRFFDTCFSFGEEATNEVLQSLAKPVSGGAQKIRARRPAASQAQASAHGHFLLHLPFISLTSRL